MSQYHAPLHDIEFLAASVFPLDAHLEDCGSSLDASLVRSVVLEAGKFAQSVLDPINRAGDLEGCRLQDGAVRVPDASSTPIAPSAKGDGTACASPRNTAARACPMCYPP